MDLSQEVRRKRGNWTKFSKREKKESKEKRSMKRKWRSSPLTGRLLCSQPGRPEWTPSCTASSAWPMSKELVDRVGQETEAGTLLVEKTQISGRVDLGKPE